MLTLGSLLNGFVYDHIDHFANIVYDGGYDTVIDGIHVLDDPFTIGTLFNITSELYIHYKKNNDERVAHTEDMLHAFISYLDGRAVTTWGKISLTRGLWELKKAGCLDIITDAELAVCEEKSRYTDFLDKEKCELINYSANYMQVAFAIANYREKLGFDKDNYSDVILVKLEGLLSGGWMDDQPGAHRYDRYSMMLPSEAVDNFVKAGKPIPQRIKDSLHESLELVLFMANKRGDGVNYGRSLSVHGDLGACEVISSAFAIDLVKPEDKQLAIDYSIAVLQKVFDFWYDDERKSINIWLDGRTTNEYRNISRYLEVNVDFASHLLSLMHNFEIAGVSDVEYADSIPSPATWQYKHTVFEKNADGIWSLVTLRKDDKLIMLPLAGGGVLCKRSTYQPFPHLNNYLDACPNGEYPYLIPEYTDRFLDKYRPSEFYEDVSIKEENGKVTVVATGKLSRMNGQSPWYVNPNNKFTTTYTFDGDEVCVEFANNIADYDAIMYSGTFFDGQDLEVFGFDVVNEIPNITNPMYRSHHGAFKHVYIHETHGSNKLGYKARLY